MTTFVKRRWWLMPLGLFSALVSLACGGVFGEDAPPGPEPERISEAEVAARYPSLLRLADAALPFPVHRDLVAERDYLTEEPVEGSPWFRTTLFGIAALRDRIVIVYPPGDRDGLDLAQAGVDRPWTREPLSDLPLEDLGDLAV